MDNVKGEYMEACSVSGLWRSLEADARALNVKYQEVVEPNKANLSSSKYLQEQTQRSGD